MASKKQRAVEERNLRKAVEARNVGVVQRLLKGPLKGYQPDREMLEDVYSHASFPLLSLILDAGAPAAEFLAAHFATLAPLNESRVQSEDERGRWMALLKHADLNSIRNPSILWRIYQPRQGFRRARMTVLQLLLDHGADPTPLIVEKLSSSANPHVTLRHCDSWGLVKVGFNGLHVAAAHSNQAFARRLLGAGVDVNAVTNSGDTALSLAKTPDMAELLLEAGAHLRPEYGILKCALRGHAVLFVARLLLVYGVTVQTEDYAAFGDPRYLSYAPGVLATLALLDVLASNIPQDWISSLCTVCQWPLESAHAELRKHLTLKTEKLL